MSFVREFVGQVQAFVFWFRDVQFSPGDRNFLFVVIALGFLGGIPGLWGYVAFLLFLLALFVFLKGDILK